MVTAISWYPLSDHPQLENGLLGEYLDHGYYTQWWSRSQQVIQKLTVAHGVVFREEPRIAEAFKRSR